jgi:hypothetical protein
VTLGAVRPKPPPSKFSDSKNLAAASPFRYTYPFTAMNSRVYELLRYATQEEYYQAINDPEDELYDVLWDIFETVVIEPAEIFDSDFRDRNQFRYRIDGGATLEFFPEAAYFRKRAEPDPYRDDSDAAGIHLKFSILPYMSCLFSVGFQVWGRAERSAFRRIWQNHKDICCEILKRAKPMVFTAATIPAMEKASSLEEMLDAYFSRRDPENFIELQYSFAQFDETDVAQSFIVYMAFLYHSIKTLCYRRENIVERTFEKLREFYSNRPPDLPAPLPCVEIITITDSE